MSWTCASLRVGLSLAALAISVKGKGLPSSPCRRTPRNADGGALVFVGRHPAVVGSSLIDLGGVTTATVLQGDRPDVRAEIAHETFHVFCRVRHPAWGANEMSALTYPVEDPEVLTLRRLEAEALLRAVLESSAGWAAAAVSLRQDRFERLAESAVRYERDLERCEGLAFYVEGKEACAIRCVDALAMGRGRRDCAGSHRGDGDPTPATSRGVPCPPGAHRPYRVELERVRDSGIRPDEHPAPRPRGGPAHAFPEAPW